MNKISVTILGIFFIAISLLYVLFFFNKERIAYVDTGKILESSKEMQTLKKKLKGDTEKAQANLDTLTMEFQQMLRKYEKDLSKMTAKEKELSKELLESKRNNLLQYQQAVQGQMMKEEQKETQVILSKINKIITEYGKRNNYKVILATSNGNIAFADESIDVTGDILKEINTNQ